MTHIVTKTANVPLWLTLTTLGLFLIFGWFQPGFSNSAQCIPRYLQRWTVIDIHLWPGQVSNGCSLNASFICLSSLSTTIESALFHSCFNVAQIKSYYELNQQKPVFYAKKSLFKRRRSQFNVIQCNEILYFTRIFPEIY